MPLLGSNVYTDLYPHQKKALTFLLEREKERETPTKAGWLWQPRKDTSGRIRAWFNPVTGKEVTKEPPEAKGGILADDVCTSRLSFAVLTQTIHIYVQLDGSRENHGGRLTNVETMEDDARLRSRRY